MGVTGLWKLVEPCGSPVPIETLDGKILAIDISIWLHQVVKGFQDNKGSLLPHAHLLGLFHRLCKLLYYRIRPVFVFDGLVPQLKRDTIARRHHQRSKINNEANRIQSLLLESLAKEKLVQQALGVNAQFLTKSPNKRKNNHNNKNENEKDDIFILPELPAQKESKKNQEYMDSCLSSFLEVSEADSFFDDSNPWGEYTANIQAIDVRSEHFKSLPPEVRHEILVDIKDTRKQSSWGRLHELPSSSNEFSSFQMKRLLKRRAVQESIEETEKEMGERALTFTDLQNFFTEEGILDPENIHEKAKPVCSDEAVRFMLVRDLRKTLLKDNKNNVSSSIKNDSAVKISVPEDKVAHNLEEPKKSNECFGNQLDEINKEHNDDLALAIALSVEDEAEPVYSNEDYNYNTNVDIKLNRQQRNQLKNAAIGPARAYMIEYGGLNDEEVGEIMEKTQVDYDTENEDFNVAKGIVAPLSYISTQCTYKQSNEINPGDAEISKQSFEVSSQEISLRMSDSSETDSDLEEVVDNIPMTCKNVSNLEVVIDTQDRIFPEDDLFTDIFGSKEEKPSEIVAETFVTKCSISNESSEIIIVDSNQSIDRCSNVNWGSKDKKFVQTNGPKAPITMENVATTTQMSSIFNDLKKQANEVKNINLDNVNINEIIEIYDSDDQRLEHVTPNKSPKFETPTKNKSINEYFETKYVVKRTPESNKKKDDKRERCNVKSPFFVKKSNSSHRKECVMKLNESSLRGRKLSKASKTLFGNTSKSPENKEEVNANLCGEDLLKTATSIVNEQNSEQLEVLASELAKERRDLEIERNRQDRMGTAINQTMHSECQELLRLFGIPYVIAPMEAEAQCAFLDSANLTQGTITDDSDIWLFGGRTVYKNFFEQNKHVLKFEADKISHAFNCDRAKLIQLACLVGSDYTTGIHGIGTVTALEILATFSLATKPTKEDCSEQSITTSSVLSTLYRFRDWFKIHKDLTQPTGSSTRLNLRKKLKNIELNDGFPNPAVIEEYLFPTIDDSKATFSWGYPDVESIHAFAKKVFGWTTVKTDEVLKPVLKRINDKQTQSSIRNYFTIKSALKPRDLKVSKRVQKAIDTMAGKLNESEVEMPVIKKRGNNRCRNIQNEATKTHNEMNNSVQSNSVSDVASTSSVLKKEICRRSSFLPESKPVVRQRENDKDIIRRYRENTAALLNKSTSVMSVRKYAKKRRTE
ncbi:DNA excision repair protein ERCC-5 isoform X2 [Bactrocera neohumeralis]|uniref:DNA repair protein complementing XP-G cells isoform X2 n=1 Tax=Bactrocera tryoni TaxID=59916 RepID=UPI001A95DC26|nr:DNA repair protein complementing XP-G cells isoform X2 [Bactrocera tryoni]XP_050338368.1 DNA excision repair protein ERCC-5 isoform X2 [Bactrocera neohumeralis]